ncbi:hypothetical protein TNCV_964691 [Trichonephila clavipes]|nr:hypothetical protein TNCV_964691 [Trichonephila clavipes]
MYISGVREERTALEGQQVADLQVVFLGQRCSLINGEQRLTGYFQMNGMEDDIVSLNGDAAPTPIPKSAETIRRLSAAMFTGIDRFCFMFSVFNSDSFAATVLARPTSITKNMTAKLAEWSRYWIMAGLVTSSSPVSLKTCRAEKRCTINLSRAQTSFRWCGVVVRRWSC